MYSPQEVEALYVKSGQVKVITPISKLFMLGIMAGIFIALAGVAANTGASMVENPGIAKLVGALIFPGGLAMVILAGSELFTGNCLMIISKWAGKITWLQMFRCWVPVYIGNFIGSVFVSFMMAQAHQFSLFKNAVALFTIQTAAAKVSLSIENAFLLGIFCNFLVCIAVWIGMAGTSPSEKMAGIYLPIFLFVISGFEHSIANMYYISAGLFAAGDSTYAGFAAAHGIDLTNLTWQSFLLGNLLPVTLGNIVGGCLMVGTVYYFAYHKKEQQ